MYVQSQNVYSILAAKVQKDDVPDGNRSEYLASPALIEFRMCLYSSVPCTLLSNATGMLSSRAELVLMQKTS